jgi:hypothetical protein
LLYGEFIWSAIPLDTNGSSIGISTGVANVVNNGGGSKWDILAGLAFTWDRAVSLTIGRAFGTYTALAPGYNNNGPIPASTAVPVLTNKATNSWFVGLSYALSGSVKASPTASPTPTPPPKS